MLSGRVAERYGLAGLADDTIYIKAEGVGGQSWGAWVAKGITIELEGEANDYVGKGLSGGIAYMLDEEGGFIRRCNMAMVELEPVLAEDDALEALDHQGGDLETMGRVDVSHDMTRFDAVRLRQLITNHLHYTASQVAKRVLDDWTAYLPRFVKVMPVDYRRALTEMQAQHRRPPGPPARQSLGSSSDPRLYQ